MMSAGGEGHADDAAEGQQAKPAQAGYLIVEAIHLQGGLVQRSVFCSCLDCHPVIVNSHLQHPVEGSQFSQHRN